MKIASYIEKVRKYNIKTGFLRSHLLPAATAIVLSLGASSCLLNRVVDVRNQFCDFETNFSFVNDGSLRFLFHQPVLLESDIGWLVGVPPTEVNEFANKLSIKYVLNKVNVPNEMDSDIQLDLTFERIDERYKLVSLQFDPLLSTVLGPEFLDDAAVQSAAGTMCEAGWRFGTTRVVLDISNQNLDQLPDRDKIQDVLGQPLKWDIPSNSITYEYRLSSDDSSPPIARFTIWFDKWSTKPTRFEASYGHFRAFADFAEKEMTVSVRI